MNFLWVYSSEAHPDQDFPPGQNTSDWEWPDSECAETGDQEDRARRAKILKELFDCQELKFGADNNQNTVKSAFMGGGYYSGFIIDCDKQVLVQEAWAWGDADGQWMGLPLTNIDGLYNKLDSYLADPPECFNPPGSDADADSDADGDVDADGDADSDADGDSDSDSDGDGDADDDDNDNDSGDDDDDNDDSDDDDDNNDDDNNDDENHDDEGDSAAESAGGGSGGCHHLVGSPASPLLTLLFDLF